MTRRLATRPWNRLLSLMLLSLCAAALAPSHTASSSAAAAAESELSSSPAELNPAALHAHRAAIEEAAAARQAAEAEGAASWRRGAADLLRMGLEWNQEDADEQRELQEKQAQRRDTSTQQRRVRGVHDLASRHVEDTVSALWMPLDWLLHVSLGRPAPHVSEEKHGTTSGEHGSTPHSLDGLANAMRSMLGLHSSAHVNSAHESLDFSTDASDEDLDNATAQKQSLRDAPLPAQFVRFTDLSGWIGTDPTLSADGNSSLPLLCVSCNVSQSQPPLVHFQAIDNTAVAGVHYSMFSTDPLSFTQPLSASMLPASLHRSTGLGASVQFQVLPLSIDPFASLDNRRESLLERNFTLRISQAQAPSVPLPIQLSEATATEDASFGVESSTVVRLRSQYLPALYFTQSSVPVTDLDSVVIFSVACARCALLSVNAVIRASTASYLSQVALADLWGSPTALAIPLPFGSAQPASASLSTTQPDLSLAGWTARGLGNPVAAWMDPPATGAGTQVAHVALHLAPVRTQRISRALALQFDVASIEDVEAGLPARNGSSSAFIASSSASDAVQQAVPLLVLSSSSQSQWSSTSIPVAPTLYCGPNGFMANASRTLYTCNTSSNVVEKAVPVDAYNVFLTGTLLDTFSAEPLVQLDPSITSNITCDDVHAWFSTDNDGSQWFENHVANQPNYASGSESVREGIWNAACLNETASASSAALNTSLVQHCQLLTRCYSRQCLCHSWTDRTSFCVCPFDRTGSACEVYQRFQCDVRLEYPAMDIQLYKDPASKEKKEYSCPQPTSFHSRLPSTWRNEGSDSSVAPLPPSRTDLQKKFNYFPSLDGEAPCLQFPAVANEKGWRSNPSVMQVHENQGRNIPQGTQQFMFSLQCTFFSDQDPSGSSTAFPRSPDAEPLTYSHIRQAPDVAIESWLEAEGFDWDRNYDSNFPWRYDVLRWANSSSSADGGSSDTTLISNGRVEFAASAVNDPSNPLRLRMHPFNSVRHSDSSRDVLSVPASIGVLRGPPSPSLVSRAVREGNPALIANSTMSLVLNFSTLGPNHARGGRVLVETFIEAVHSFSSLSVPRGLDESSARFPVRLWIDLRDWTSLPPAKERRITLMGTLALVLLCLAAAAAGWKYYERRRAEAFERIVRRAKQKAAKRRAEEESHAAASASAKQGLSPASRAPTQTTARHDSAAIDAAHVELEEL